MRRVELFSGIAVAAMTAWAIVAILWIPIGTTTLITPTHTTTTFEYALDHGVVSVFGSVALFTVLGALLLFAVIEHMRHEPQVRSPFVALLGFVYAASSILLVFNVGGAAQPAGTVALICAVAALIPSRSRLPITNTRQP